MRCMKASNFTRLRDRRLQDRGQQLHGDLRQALGPSRLLHLEAMHLDGQLRGAIEARQVDEAPAFELRAIAEVGIFGEGIVLPAARVVDHGDAQNAGRAVEVEEVAGARARAVLEDEMAVEQHAFHFGEEVVIAVQVAPARLHHADLRIGEVVNGAREEIGGREEIGVEDGDQFAGGGLQAFLQRAGFEAVAVGAVMILDGISQGAIALDQRLGEGRGVVGGIVQHLDLQQFLRVLHLDDFFDQPLHHIALVIKGKLDGDRGSCSKRFGGSVVFFFRCLKYVRMMS